MSMILNNLEKLKNAAVNAPERTHKTDHRRIDALKRALQDVFREQSILITKIIADKKVEKADMSAFDSAASRLGGLYRLALSMECDEELKPYVLTLLQSIEKQAEALDLALENDISARDAAFHAFKELEKVPPSSEPGDPAAIHSAILHVYDKSTGRSKYDADADGWLGWSLRCPDEGCRQVRSYRMLPAHPTHKLQCTSCRREFLAYTGIVLRSDRNFRHSTASYRLHMISADGNEHSINFEHMRSEGGDMELPPGDLVILTYEPGGRLKLVKNYSTGHEIPINNQGRCFVAAAVAGPFSPEVRLLRNYRDQVLSKSFFGRMLIKVYEITSPYPAFYISRSEKARKKAYLLIRLAACFAANSEEKN